MNKKNRIRILVGALCVALLLLIVVAAVILDSRSPDPILGVFQTETTTSDEAPENAIGDTTSDEDPEDPTKDTGSDEEPEDPTKDTGSDEDPEDPTKDTGSDEELEDPTKDTGSDEDPEDPTKDTGSDEDPEDPTKDTGSDEDPKDPTEGTGESFQETKIPTSSEEEPTKPEEQPPAVVIPPETDPETGEETGISFPCQIPEYDIIIEKMGPYNGMFVEDGSNVNSQNVAMLLVHNNGDFPVEYTQIRVTCEQEELLFDISALPAGAKLVVQEKTGKTISEDKAISASALVVQRAKMEMSEGKIEVKDNGDNTLTIKNLTDEMIPTVRVFYKYYMEEEKLFVGGIAFTVRISRLGAGASVTIQPSHYTSQTSRVVMALTYDSEV